MWKTAPARLGMGAGSAKKYIVLLLAILVLSACASGGTRDVATRVPPPSFVILPAGDKAGAPSASAVDRTKPQGEETGLVAALQTVEPPPKCRFKDRFDRSAALSFTSEDGQRVLALKMKTSGTEVTNAMIRLTYHFGQAPKKKKAHCLADSRIQGLLPSLYREVIVPDKKEVWQNLRHGFSVD